MSKQQLARWIAMAVGLLLVTRGIAFAQEDIGADSIGRMEFQKNCAVCHGIGGKGDGPFLEFLRETPPDLTLISKRHNGVFPVEKIYMWVRDPQRIRAHGTKEMPIWGDRYSKEIIETYGPDYTGPGSSVHERILELVFYIGTLQQ